MNTKKEQIARCIKVSAEDNVAIVVNEGGLPKGTIFDFGLELKDDIPQGHKVVLRDIKKDEEIIRYNQVIGYANKDLSAGNWVNEFMMNLPTPPELDTLLLQNTVQTQIEPMEKKYFFSGYRNKDGTAGIRNVLGILPSVQCVVGVLNKAVEKLKQDILHKYPHVDDIVVLAHSYGCGVAIHALEAEVPIRALQNLATHPNLGGELLIVGLGCEKLQPEQLIPQGTHPEVIVLQEEHGYQNMIQSIVEAAEKCLKRLEKRRRVSCPLSDLIVGLQCGGSDSFSGITANPAIGYAADLLVRCGASVMFSEVTEVRDGIHLLLPRAANQAVGQRLIEEMRWYDTYLELGGADRSANPAPGNKKGGLANIVEKALGSIAKSGSMPISDVLAPGEKVRGKGLIYAATPASDFVCGTMQLASGMHLQVFSTGRGTTYGLALAPVLKISTRNELKQKWEDIIDINAGRIATGEATIEEVGKEIFELIIEIASGKKESWAEHWKLYNDLCLFNPAPIT